MKFFSKTFLFCFFVILSLEFLDSISAAKFRQYGNDSGILGGNVRERRIRSSDENEHGEKDGEDVILSGTGRINLTLIYEVLEFEICDNCAGTSRVCYESLNGWEDSEATGSCSDSNSCEFMVKDDEDGIYFGKQRVLKTYFIPTMDGFCLSTIMKFPYAEVLPTNGYKSCEPKIDDDKMIKLFVFIDPECSIKVKNARIYVPEVTSTTKVPPTKSPSKHTSEASFPVWGYIIIAVGIVVLIVILIIGFIAYHLYKTHQPSKRIPPNIDEIKSKPTVSNAKVASVETPTNKSLKLTKVEPNMNNENKSKKSQKNDKKKETKIQELTVEDVSKISQQESVASVSSKQLSPLPPPNPAACYPVVKPIIPHSMKSAKNDSLNEKDKSVMMESESVKF